MPLKLAKRLLRRLRLRRLGVYEELDISRLALAYRHGGWMVHPDVIRPDSIVYSFGVGSNIAWDLAMIERFGVTIHAFDPTPRSVAWVREQGAPPQFVFHDFGIGATDGTMTFFPPMRDSSFNYSSIDRGQGFDEGALIRAPVHRLATIMRDLGHDHIDVLKMDIEGGEYAVIDEILSSRIPIRQLLVEFHHNFRSVGLSKTIAAVQELHRHGYRIFHLSGRSYEMSFLHMPQTVALVGSAAADGQVKNGSVDWNASSKALEKSQTPGNNSYTETRSRFATAGAATKYATSLVDSATHRREVRCIREGLQGVARGAKVLDLPCGSGRLLPELLEDGYEVTAADSSPHMIEQAQATAARLPVDARRIRFAVADALATRFEDREFDAVVCNRLLHHYRESQTRRAVLREMARISRGPVVVSFFCSASWDGLVFHGRDILSGWTATDRIPIAYRTMEADVREAGLTIRRVLPTRPGISKQWYLVLDHAKTPVPAATSSGAE